MEPHKPSRHITPYYVSSHLGVEANHFPPCVREAVSQSHTNSQGNLGESGHVSKVADPAPKVLPSPAMKGARCHRLQCVQALRTCVRHKVRGGPYQRQEEDRELSDLFSLPCNTSTCGCIELVEMNGFCVGV